MKSNKNYCSPLMSFDILKMWTLCSVTENKFNAGKVFFLINVKFYKSIIFDGFFFVCVNIHKYSSSSCMSAGGISHRSRLIMSSFLQSPLIHVDISATIITRLPYQLSADYDLNFLHDFNY